LIVLTGHLGQQLVTVGQSNGWFADSCGQFDECLDQTFERITCHTLNTNQFIVTKLKNSFPELSLNASDSVSVYGFGLRAVGLHFDQRCGDG